VPISFQPRRYRGIQYGQSITGYRPGQARPATYYTRNEDAGPDARQREMVAKLSRLEQQIRVSDRAAKAKPRDSYGRTSDERAAVLAEVFAAAGYAQAPSARDLALAANMSNEEIVESVLPEMDPNAAGPQAPEVPAMNDPVSPEMPPPDQTEPAEAAPPINEPTLPTVPTLPGDVPIGGDPIIESGQSAVPPAYTPPVYEAPPPPAYVIPDQRERIETAAPPTTLYPDEFGNMVPEPIRVDPVETAPPSPPDFRIIEGGNVSLPPSLEWQVPSLLPPETPPPPPPDTLAVIGPYAPTPVDQSVYGAAPSAAVGGTEGGAAIDPGSTDYAYAGPPVPPEGYTYDENGDLVAVAVDGGEVTA